MLRILLINKKNNSRTISRVLCYHLAKIVLVIYLLRLSLDASIVLPSNDTRASNPNMTLVYLNFQPISCTDPYVLPHRR